MEPWEWALAALGVLSGLFVCGSIVWGVFDVLRENRLDQTSRILWVLAMFILPLFGVVAWLSAEPRLSTNGFPQHIRNTL
ncbi:PLD nuclease N-terminal domain-containing protein [Arthrobacter globiformis]|uniref:PLD nuclease N-terminal domain-containing protein n=1 Tax=Arthrobacter globiformis TaxID=1665 RepID=UPI0027D8AECB|nr:PLD nuclease N-terminal domain-containing protein [Arthrobacter globiformis]